MFDDRFCKKCIIRSFYNTDLPIHYLVRVFMDGIAFAEKSIIKNSAYKFIIEDEKYILSLVRDYLNDKVGNENNHNSTKYVNISEIIKERK